VAVLKKLRKWLSENVSVPVLIIDDEADQASVSFVADKQKEDGIDLGKISESISNLS
jgi:hypothetical protein